MATTTGTNDSETLNGTPGDDVIDGLDGNDTINGWDGNDILRGGNGNDRILTGDGEDTVDGGPGDDEVNGYLLNPSTGEYTFWPASGNKRINGGLGQDFLVGGSGDDWISGDEDGDFLYGLEGNDTLYGGAGDDRLDGGGGNDLLPGGFGNDFILTGDGEDQVFGGDGNDSVNGSPTGDSGSYSHFANSGPNNVSGGNGDDFIVGGSDEDTLAGDSGNDRLYGRGGDDTLIGGEGNDSLEGGEGDDWLEPGPGINVAKGGSGNDYYRIQGATTYIDDESGIDAAYVEASYVKLPSSIESVTYAPGVEALPYWIDALVADSGNGDYFRTLLGDSLTFYFAFPTSAPTYYAHAKYSEGWEPLNAAQKLRVNEAFDYLGGIVGITFIETNDVNQKNTLAFANNTQSGSAAYAFQPSSTLAGSDVFMNKGIAENLVMPDNSYSLLTLIHEIGHALGLKHPFSAPDAGGDVAEPPYLSAAEDTTTWTVMSYTKNVQDYALALAPLDIAALHYLYGPSHQAWSGNDVHLFDPLAANFIWDGAGIDTLSFAAATERVTASLEPGVWGYMGALKGTLISDVGQVTINFGSAIENLVGSNFDDELYGNDLGNEVWGGGGADALYGGAGNDTLWGGEGADTLHGGHGLDTAAYVYARSQYKVSLAQDLEAVILENLLDPNDYDTLYDIELFLFDAVPYTYDTLFASEVEDQGDDDGVVVPNDLLSWIPAEFVELMGLTPYTNVIMGDDSANELIGTSGPDILQGSGGADTLRGAAGNDLFFGFENYEDDAASPGSALLDRIQAQSGLVDHLYGGPGNDVYVLDKWLNGTPLIFENEDEGLDLILGDLQVYSIPEYVEFYINDLSVSDGMGSFEDVVITGNKQNNWIQSSGYSTNWQSQERFFGGDGDDTLMGYGGDDYLDGGAGHDIAVYTGNKSDYLLTKLTTGMTIQDTRQGYANDGKDTLVSIETLRFADGEFSFTDLFPPDSLSGKIYHWKSKALLSGVQVGGAATITSSDGAFEISGLSPGAHAVVASLAVSSNETTSVVTSADALAALKIAVGRSPNSDGSAPTPYQLISADVNGSGTITSADALAILKMAVKRSDAPAQEWIFVDEAQDFWDETAATFTTSQSYVPKPAELLVSADPTLRPEVNLVAMRKGDVNGSWMPPEGHSVLTQSYFDALLEANSGVLTLQQFG